MSKIQWTDATWNPIVGCSVVSPGCKHCYAMRQARRHDKAGSHYAGTTAPSKAGPVWSGKVALAPEHIVAAPLSWRKPRRVFVNSMGDLFHEDVPDEWIDRVFAVMALAPQHVFQVLTKRAERMREYLNATLVRDRIDTAAFDWLDVNSGRDAAEQWFRDAPRWPLPNVWLGVSIEDRARKSRLENLRYTPAAVRFLSCEPLLEDLGQLDLTGVGWVIVGGESGPGARPCDLAWIRSIVAQCRVAGIPAFVKQLGARPIEEFAPGCDHFLSLRDRKGGEPEQWPADLRVREFPAGGREEAA